MIKWIRADEAQAEKEAAVAAAYEDAAEIANRRRKVMHGKTLGAIFAIVDALPDAIRARGDTDALERVRQEAWQQGYETGTGEIAGAIDEAAAAKRMYRKARNEALREAAAIKLDVEVRNDCWWYAALDTEAAYRKAILALIPDQHKGDG